MTEQPQLDESLYSLAPDELAFYQEWTGITNETELKQHILDIQARAYKIFPYPCIRRFAFAKLKVLRHPAYNQVLQYPRNHPDGIYLELGCCFGNDARKVVLDGHPVENVIASDLYQEFWDLGHELFKDDSTKFPASFVQGDIFSPKLLDMTGERASTRPSDLRDVKSLTELLGHVSIIHTSSFFHLFSEEDQLKLAHGCVALLTLTCGAMVFGSHVAAPKLGLYEDIDGPLGAMFCHSPESWGDMWKQAGMEARVKLKVESELDSSRVISGGRQLLVWSVSVA